MTVQGHAVFLSDLQVLSSFQTIYLTIANAWLPPVGVAHEVL